MGLLLLMGDSGFRGALDSLGTGLESAWSVGRRLRAAYSGPVIRVRRSSDNAEQDFSGSGASGAVSVSAVEAFCGAGDGFLTTIYGQAGNSRNFTQSSTTIQPLVVSSGVANTKNGRLAAAFNGATSNRRMSVVSSTATYKFLHDGTSSTIYSVQEVTDDAAAAKTLLGNLFGATDVGCQFRFASNETLIVLIRGTSPDIPVSANKAGGWTFNALSALIDADNATAASRESVWQDGVELGTDNTSTAAVSSANATNDFFLGTTAGGTNPFNGNFCELVIWSQNIIANRSIWEQSAEQFWGTP